jgi:hypothetical protein
MRNNDVIHLEEAYKLVEENKFRSAVAAAAMGLGSLAHGQMTADDYEDRANPPYTPETHVQQSPESHYQDAKDAYKKALEIKHVDEITLKKIAMEKEFAERYALFLIQHGRPIPNIIRRAATKYTDQLEKDFANPFKD